MTSEQNDIEAKLISKDLVTGLLKSNYDLLVEGDPEMMKGGVESAVWLVKTNNGKWYAKAYGLHEGPVEHIQEEMEFYEHLSKNGVNVPEVRENNEHKKVDTLITPQGKHGFVLMKYENLKEVSPSSVTREELEKIATAIAELHKVGQTYPRKGELSSDGVIFIPYNAFENFISSPNSQEYTATQLAELKELMKRGTNYLENHPISKDLTKSMLHGDMAFGHAQFLPNNEIYFFDFGDRWFGPMVQDLAVMTENLYRAEDISFERFEQLRTWLMTGYLTKQNLTPDDLKAIKPLVVLRGLMAVSYLSDIAKQINRPVDSYGIKGRFKLAEYLLSSVEN